MSIIRRKPSRRNTGRFLKSIMWSMMNVMSGIEWIFSYAPSGLANPLASSTLGYALCWEYYRPFRAQVGLTYEKLVITKYLSDTS
jgi:hypothetical protein